jgi:hypothetical protein
MYDDYIGIASVTDYQFISCACRKQKRMPRLQQVLVSGILAA